VHLVIISCCSSLSIVHHLAVVHHLSFSHHILWLGVFNLLSIIMASLCWSSYSWHRAHVVSFLVFHHLLFASLSVLHHLSLLHHLLLLHHPSLLHHLLFVIISPHHVRMALVLQSVISHHGLVVLVFLFLSPTSACHLVSCLSSSVVVRIIICRCCFIICRCFIICHHCFIICRSSSSVIIMCLAVSSYHHHCLTALLKFLCRICTEVYRSQALLHVAHAQSSWLYPLAVLLSS